MIEVLCGARVVVPAGVLDPGWVSIAGGRIDRVGVGRPPVPGADLGGAWVVPGFVDLHVHGGGGHDFTASPADMAAGVEFHRAHGTTRTLVSLVPAPPDRLAEQLGWVAALAGAAGATVAGAHLEGPFLSTARCGALDPGQLRPPDVDVFDRLAAAAGGWLRVLTVAPELPGAPSLIARARRAGVVVALGHSDAGYETACAGFAAGAAHVTHLFNAMSNFGHREPGLVGAALASAATVELINDGVHLHDAVVAQVLRWAPERAVLVTDAIAAAGAGDGDYRLGGQEVRVDAGQARLAGSGRLAGSTLTMEAAFRRAVSELGVPVPLAAAAAATNPARVLGLEGRGGALAPGYDADLVVLDDDLHCQRVMVAGDWR